MGHEINYDVFPMTKSKREISMEVNEKAIYYSDSRSELPYEIRWYDKDIQDSYDDALEFVEKHDDGWYDQLAVPFRKVDAACLVSPKTTALEEKIKELNKLYCQKDRQLHYQEAKAKLIGCKKCGSKISTDYLVNHLRTNYCPVCRVDLRPDSVLKDLKNKKVRLETLNQQLKEEERRLNQKSLKNATLMWFVKTEYHI